MSAQHTPGPMLPLWRLAKPWTDQQWHDIVTTAQNARICRQQAAHYHQLRKLSRQSGIGSPDVILDDARRHEYRARQHEQWLHRMAEVRGSDLDEAKLDQQISVVGIANDLGRQHPDWNRERCLAVAARAAIAKATGSKE